MIPRPVSHAIPREITAKLLIGLLVVAVGLSPRFPVSSSLEDHAIELRIEDILLVGLCLWAVSNLYKRHINRVFEHACLYLGCVLLSTIWGVGLGSTTPLRGALFGFKEVEYILVMLFVSIAVNSMHEAATLVGLILATGVANVLWVSWQLATGINRTLWFTSYYANRYESYGPGIVGELTPFPCGAFFMLLSLLSLSLLLHAQQRTKRLAYGYMAVCCTLCLLATVSRINIGACLVGAIALALSVGLRRAKPLIFVGGAAAAILAIAVSSGIYQLPNRFDRSAVRRSEAIRSERVWGPILQNPERLLFGSGKGSLGYAPGLAHLIGARQSEVTEAHNYFLRVLVESGLPGLVTFLGMLVSIASLCIRVRRRAACPLGRAIAGACLAALLAMCFAATVQDSFTPVIPNELFWILVGLTIAVGRISSNQGHALRLYPEEASVRFTPVAMARRIWRLH